MALNLGGGVGNPGYSLGSPTFNPATGGYNPAPGPVWVGGQNADPRGPGQETLQAFYNWYVPGLNKQVGANPQITDATAPGYNPNPARQVSIGGAQPNTMQPGVQPGMTTLNQPTTNGMNATGIQMGATATQNGVQQTGAATGQGGMAAALTANPQLLEQYWAQNPDALRSAIGGNPSMFAPTGLQRDGNTAPPTGLIGSEQAMYGGLLGGIGQISQFQQEGQGASALQAALSGAMGPEAQAQAYQNYQESPGQQYLRDKSEQAILRNSAATGGLGGGNVLQALQRNAIGLAAQDFDNSFNRLGVTANRGYDASRTAADMTFGTGQALAGGRTRAGEMLAGNYGNTAQGLAGLQSQFGNDLSNVTGQGAGNLASLLSGAGQSGNQNYQQLAALLANIATGQGSQVAGLPGVPGTQQNPGMLGSLGQLAGGIGGLLTGWG